MYNLKCIAVAISLFSYSLSAVASDEFILPTHEGPALGRMTEEGGAFIPNVPYMQEPTGDLRFKAPRPPKHREDLWDGGAKTVKPAQTASLFSGVENAQQLGKLIGKEGDAAYLNIYTPEAAPTKKRPIFVWYHGGSNLQGYASDPLYNPSELAKSLDAIVVTVNYRLGIFGAFYHPAFEGQDPADASGNYVTLDGIQALKWVRANMGALGGDINNITVAGESAGGINVWGLLQSPLAHRLFAKAYVASAFPNNFPKMVAKSNFEKFINEALVLKGLARDMAAAKEVLAKMTNKQIRDFVHSLSTTEALAASADLLPVHHIADGHVLPASGMATLPALTNRVPLMVTTTTQEGNFFFAQSMAGLTEQEYWNELTGKVPPTALENFLKSKKFEEFKVTADNFTLTVNQLVDATLFASGTLTTPIYRANLEMKSQHEPFRSVLGASHGMDLLALFTPKNLGGNHGFSFFNRDLQDPNFIQRAEAYRAYVKGFVQNGDPNSMSKGPKWNRWNSLSLQDLINPLLRRTLDFKEDGVREEWHSIKPVRGTLSLINSLGEIWNMYKPVKPQEKSIPHGGGNQCSSVLGS